jgi:hypothetical protein
MTSWFFESIEEVRKAVGEFVEIYNEEWLIEKNGFKCPVKPADNT